MKKSGGICNEFESHIIKQIKLLEYLIKLEYEKIIEYFLNLVFLFFSQIFVSVLDEKLIYIINLVIFTLILLTIRNLGLCYRNIGKYTFELKDMNNKLLRLKQIKKVPIGKWVLSPIKKHNFDISDRGNRILIIVLLLKHTFTTKVSFYKI